MCHLYIFKHACAALVGLEAIEAAAAAIRLRLALEGRVIAVVWTVHLVCCCLLHAKLVTGVDNRMLHAHFPEDPKSIDERVCVYVRYVYLNALLLAATSLPLDKRDETEDYSLVESKLPTDKGHDVDFNCLRYPHSVRIVISILYRTQYLHKSRLIQPYPFLASCRWKSDASAISDRVA